MRAICRTQSCGRICYIKTPRRITARRRYDLNELVCPDCCGSLMSWRPEFDTGQQVAARNGGNAIMLKLYYTLTPQENVTHGRP